MLIQLRYLLFLCRDYLKYKMTNKKKKTSRKDARYNYLTYARPFKIDKTGNDKIMRMKLRSHSVYNNTTLDLENDEFLLQKFPLTASKFLNVFESFFLQSLGR